MDTSLTEMFIASLYSLIGFMGMLSIVFLTWGFVVFVSRLGTLRREEGHRVMEWAVRFIITTLLLIGFLRFVQHWIA